MLYNSLRLGKQNTIGQTILFPSCWTLPKDKSQFLTFFIITDNYVEHGFDYILCLEMAVKAW